MKKDDIFPGKYLRASDIGDSEPTVVIAKSEMEQVGNEDKLVVYFQGKTKGVVLNVTNFDRICYITGSDDTDGWPGHKITLYTELATYQGKTSPSIRVKPPGKKQNSGAHVVENKGRYDTLEKAAPVDEAADDGQEIPW